MRRRPGKRTNESSHLVNPTSPSDSAWNETCRSLPDQPPQTFHDNMFQPCFCIDFHRMFVFHFPPLFLFSGNWRCRNRRLLGRSSRTPRHLHIWSFRLYRKWLTNPVRKLSHGRIDKGLEGADKSEKGSLGTGQARPPSGQNKGIVVQGQLAQHNNAISKPPQQPTNKASQWHKEKDVVIIFI